MKTKRTITALARQKGRVYVYLADDNIGNQFMQQSVDEGFTFGDGVKPTARSYAEIMAVNHNITINFVGANGRIAFGSGVKKIGDENFVRVDFEKYIAGEEDYLC